MNTLRSLLHAALLAAVVALGLAGPALAQQKSDPDKPEANATWQQMRTTLFQDRAITTPADAVLSLEAPERAQDAAIVPISIRTHVEQRADRYIERVYLMIDNNPSPMGATFHFTPTSGRADIETRVRIDAYTHVRAIAEMNTGELYMATRFVKASMQGWQYALENPEEAAQIVVDSDDTGAAELAHQQYMMGEVAKLVDPSDAALDMATYERTVKALLDQKIIAAQPTGAYSTVVTDALK